MTPDVIFKLKFAHINKVKILKYNKDCLKTHLSQSTRVLRTRAKKTEKQTEETNQSEKKKNPLDPKHKDQDTKQPPLLQQVRSQVTRSTINRSESIKGAPTKTKIQNLPQNQDQTEHWIRYR